MHEFKESPTTRGDIRNAIANLVLVDGSQGIATSGDGKRRTLSNRLRQYSRALSELVEFEYADRPIPQQGFRILEQMQLCVRGLQPRHGEEAPSTKPGTEDEERGRANVVLTL